MDRALWSRRILRAGDRHRDVSACRLRRRKTSGHDGQEQDDDGSANDQHVPTARTPKLSTFQDPSSCLRTSARVRRRPPGLSLYGDPGVARTM